MQVEITEEPHKFFRYTFIVPVLPLFGCMFFEIFRGEIVAVMINIYIYQVITPAVATLSWAPGAPWLLPLLVARPALRTRAGRTIKSIRESAFVLLLD